MVENRLLVRFPEGPVLRANGCIHLHLNMYRQSNVPNGSHAADKKTSPSICPIVTLKHTHEV